MEDNRTFLTVSQFAKKYKGKWPSHAALRDIIFEANHGRNNFHPCIFRVRARILIWEEKFWEIIVTNQKFTENK